MNRYGYGTRLLSLLLVMIMVFSMIPALQREAAAASATGGTLSKTDKITLPIKIMDYESDGMLFEYLWGQSSHSYADYVPETGYWIDYTGTLSGLRGVTNGRGIYHGSGFSKVDLATVDGSYNGEKWANITKSSLGGKQLLRIENVKTTNIPLQWQIAKFASSVTAADVRYCTVVFRAYNCDSSGSPTLGIGTKLSENLTTRYTEGTFSGHYKLNTSGRHVTAGDRYVDVAVIDLSKIQGSFDTLYLEFPNIPAKGDDAAFHLIGVFFTPNEADAHEFGAWASCVGSMSNTDSGKTRQGNTVTLRKDSFSNTNLGFSFWRETSSTWFDTIQSIPEWLYDEGYGAGERVVFLNGGPKDLSAISASSYESTYGHSGGNATSIKVSDAIGYTLFQTFGDAGNVQGYAAVGLLEHSLGESGVPEYKEAVLNYMRVYLRNRLMHGHSHDLDGWRNYTSVSGAPNGELFGYTNGGQVDHDPNKAGVQGIPLDFATAICDHMGVKRRAQDYLDDYGKDGTEANGDSKGNYLQIFKGYPGENDGSYAEVMAKKEFLEGSWLECKKYINSWWDLAYYIMHNVWVPNSYNNLQSDYNYLELYKDSKSGNYVFDSTFSNSSGTSTVTFNKTNKVIGVSSGSYVNRTTMYEGVHAFLPVNTDRKVARESGMTNVLENSNSTLNGKNFHFSMACNGMFTFKAGQQFHFDGDDDVYLFISGELVMDLGGTHNATSSTIYLDKYVNWAKTVLANTKNYSAEQIRRAEKLNLKAGENYTFDFYFMERKAAGSNLRVETNIDIFVPDLNVGKHSWQNDEQIPDNGVIDNTQLVEYGFSLNNDTEAYKLYNYEFIDNKIGVQLDKTNGLIVNKPDKVFDKNGEKLDPEDLVFLIEGYDGNPRRPSTNKLDTIEITGLNATQLKKFLTDLTSPNSSTQSGATDSLYSGGGLWCFAKLTVRGIYYQQDKVEQTSNSFTNNVTVIAYNGAYKLMGSADHTVFKFGDPSYFQWTGKKIVVDSKKLYQDLKNSPVYYDEEIPDYGHMTMTLCDATGKAKDYPYVINHPGGDAYLEINYPTPGLKFFYIRIDDRCGKQDSFVLTLAVYVLDVKDSAVVLDYGLTANLSATGGIIGKDDTINIAGKTVLNTVIGVTGIGGTAEYIEMDSAELDALYSESMKHNEITPVNNVITDYTGKLEHPIYLDHTMPWVIEFKVTSPDGGLLFSNMETAATAGNTYLFMCPGTGFVAMGMARDDIYQNYGAWADASPNANGVMRDGTAHVYRLVNILNGDGTNMVYLYVDGVRRGALDDYHKQGGSTSDTAQDTSFISGRDFSFSYIGPGPGQRVDISRYEYIRVWEQGLELNNYRWETNASGSLMNVTTSDNGNNTNSITEYATDSTSNRDVVLNADGTWKETLTGTASNGKYYKMDKEVMLQHTKEWVIEFRYSGLDANPDNPGASEEAMIFSSLGTSASNGHEYLYLRADNGQVTIGRKDAAGHHNYGLALKDIIPGFNTSEEHTYRLENRLTDKDGAMVYLIVDGEEIGPMDHYYLAGEFINDGKDFFSNNDFKFTHISNKTGQWSIEGTLHYLQVWEDTTLNGSYGWNYENESLVDQFPGLPDGNRIEFESDLTDDGKIMANDGYFYYQDDDLYFQPTDTMGGESEVKIAFTIHENSFTPTPLADKYVDVNNELQMYKNIIVVPANVVYYEDDFPAIKYDCAGENGFEIIGSSSDFVQSPDVDSPYGNDPVYNETLQNSTGDSLHVLPINKLGPLVHFEFTGTGFEIVARTNAFDSGILFVDVYEAGAVNFDSNGNVKYDEYGIIDANAEPVAFVPVVTGYDNNENGGAEEVYSVPLISVRDLAHGSYVVVITGVPTYEYAEDGTETLVDTKLYLDGIRIYHPLNDDFEEDYYTDIENGVYFDEIRDRIETGDAAAAEWADSWTDKAPDVFISAGLNTWTHNPFGVDTQGNTLNGQKVSSMNDYLTLGPNNEVYMDGTFTNSSLVLMIKEKSGSSHSLQIAMRAMDYGVFIGAGHIYEAAKIMISYDNNGESQWKELVTIQSAAQQYYTIPYTECPVVSGYHVVALKIVPVHDDVPALVSFSSIKHKNIDFGNVNGLLTSGSGTMSVAEFSDELAEVLSSTAIYTSNESAPGADFDNGGVSANAPALLPKYPTLSFEDEIRYNIYFTAQNLESYNTADMGLITFDGRLVNGTIEDAVDVIPGATFNGTEFMVHTNGIPAKKMGDTVYFKIYFKQADGTYLYSDVFGYSALKYAQDCLDGDYDSKLQSLIVAMLNYGSTAQEFFGYKANIPMNEGLSAAQMELAADYDASMVKTLAAVDATKAQNFVMSAGSYSSVYPSVSFDGAFALNFYFKPAKAVDNGMTFYYWTEDAYNAADVLTVDNASGKCQMKTNGAEYGAVIEGIAAKEMCDAVYVVGAYESNGVTYYTNVITYSLGAYCAQIAANASSDAQALAAATAVYGYYAEAYFAE